MKIGVFAKTFPGNDAAGVLHQASTAGFEGVQYNMACSGLAALPDDIPAAVADGIASASAHTGQEIFALSATFNMIHPDIAVRRTGARQFGVIAAACRRLDVPLVTLCTGSRDPQDQWRHHPLNASQEAWRDLLSSFEAILPIAEGHGLLLGVEPELGNVVSSAQVARRLLDALKSPAIRIVLDPANLAEEVPADDRRKINEEAVGLLADRIVMAHAKDRNATGEVAAPGQGVIDFPHFLSCLKAAGFDGPLVAHGFDAAAAPAVATFLHKVRAGGLS